MRKIKIGVIGIGHLGRFHAEKFAQIPEVELVALVDIKIEKAKEIQTKIKKEYNIFPEITENYKDILNKVDAVSIVTPTITHYEIAKYFLEYKKAIFIEKPIAHEFELAKELVEIAQKYNIPFQVGYIERFQKPVKLLLNKSQNPLFIEAHRLSSFVERNLDIDVILDLMIHDIDLALKLKNYPEVEMIHAVGAPLFTNHPDIVNARVVFQDGTTCNFTASRISINKQRKFRVFEKGVYYSVDTLKKSFLEIKINWEDKDFIYEEKTFPESDPLKEELVSFIKSITNGTKVLVSGEEALKALELAFKIKQSVEENLKKL
ncbi:gfo/Idh/MocA family oxidoreductase [Candidatus Pacearchaeota archaeon]|nr:MAG: gfo/Idh/MocA family oxidoreductase [Candidatus Pacearchaeota archaeon]